MNGIIPIIQKSGKQLFIENPQKSASDNAKMLEKFKKLSKSSSDGAVLLGVCGGRNSEGEDYPGDFMNAVIIVGIPYHLPTPRVEAKIKYYDSQFNRQGWNFAYLNPAMQRANQASGRPIRKESDKGVIIFMDERFKEKVNWISEWVRKEIKLTPNLSRMINRFWN
jgi:DNA excision repair protein ERCC-2